MTSLETRISEVLNEFCEENTSNTPDFILAKYLTECLGTFNTCINLREQWYGDMAVQLEDDQSILDQEYDLNLKEVASSNFLEENGFQQTDYVHLSVMVVDLKNKPGKYYDYFEDNTVVIAVGDDGVMRIKTDPLVEDVVSLLN